jgi:predicted TIM-barrel fold metal-dependent hydrolase
MIVDCHCHAGRGDGLTGPWNTDAPLGNYLRRAKDAGIERTVVLPAFHSDYLTANQEIAELVRKHRGRLIGFAMIHPRNDVGRVEEMLTEAVGLGLRGVKVHAHDSVPGREVFDAARNLRLPVLYDVAGKAHVIDMVAPQYPDVTVIVPHLGSFADDFRAHERVIEQLARYRNLYADTSGVRRFDYLVQAVKRAGPEKLLFGSDGPWLHPGLELEKVRLLGLPPEDEARVMGGNLCEILARKPVGAKREYAAIDG